MSIFDTIAGSSMMMGIPYPPDRASRISHHAIMGIEGLIDTRPRIDRPDPDDPITGPLNLDTLDLEPRYRELYAPSFSEINIWSDFADAVEKVFKAEIIDPANELKVLRDVDNQVINNRDMLLERSNLLGQFYQDSSLFKDENLEQFILNSPLYFTEKGTRFFSDFLGYSLNSPIKVTPLWTENYVDFYSENDPNIGDPLWEGGTWYPTTHVHIDYEESRFDLSSLKGLEKNEVVSKLIYTIAPINVVIRGFFVNRIYIEGKVNISIVAQIKVKWL